jgi:hypothetical protein
MLRRTRVPGRGYIFAKRKKKIERPKTKNKEE